MGRGCAPALALVVAGCGFHLPGGSASPDGTPPADAPGDAPPGAACWAHWLAHDVAFENIHAISGVGSSAVDRDPYISHDQLTLFFSSERINGGANADVYVATRASITDEFAAPQLAATGLNSTEYETRVTLTADELTAVVSSARTGSLGGVDLFLGTRAQTSQDFTVMSAAPFVQINNVDPQHDPELSSDGSRIYFAPPGGPTQHIVVSGLRSGIYDPPVDVPGVNDQLPNADPAVSPDERVMAFSSQRAGSAGSDIYYATRADATATFEPARRLDTLDSSASDGDPALTADGCHIYFASDRQGNNFEIFTADVVP